MKQMRAEGHTLQAIADAVNVGVETVRRNTTDATFSFEKVAGADGKARVAKYKPRDAQREPEDAVFTDKTLVLRIREELVLKTSCETRIGKPETT